MYHAERMRAYRARMKATRPVIVKTKNPPMSVNERVRLYRERKKQLQKTQSLESCVSSDDLCLSSDNVQTGVVSSIPMKKPPLRAKERARLYRQHQKELLQKFRSAESVVVVSGGSVPLDLANVQTLTVATEPAKKQPISMGESVSVYEERQIQMREKQSLRLPVASDNSCSDKVQTGVVPAKPMKQLPLSAKERATLYRQRLRELLQKCRSADSVGSFIGDSVSLDAASVKTQTVATKPYQEHKKQIQKKQLLESCVGSDNSCLSSDTSLTEVVPAQPMKKTPMSAKERSKLYRQRQKELLQKYSSPDSGPSGRGGNVAVDPANMQTLTVDTESLKKQPISVRKSVMLDREQKKEIQENQILESCVGSDNSCLSSDNVQTGGVSTKPKKTLPMSAKERARLYRQRKKQMQSTKPKKKLPMSAKERARLYRQRKKQMQENQVLDLSVSATGRGMEKRLLFNSQYSRRLQLKVCSASFPFFFFEKLWDVARADSQNRSDMISESTNVEGVNTLGNTYRGNTKCKEDDRFQNQTEDESTIVTDYCKLVWEEGDDSQLYEECGLSEENEAEKVVQRSCNMCVENGYKT